MDLIKSSLCILIAVLLSSCGGNSEIPDTNPTPEVNLNKLELDENSVYPFMELKKMYAVNWKGESKGNEDFDGKTVTITGEVFIRGINTKFIDDDSRICTGARIEFRGSKFPDDSFGHDVECLFSAEMADEISALEIGSTVTVKGVIERQEVYIEPNVKYYVLTLIDGELIKE